ncbi:transcription factor LHW isoform X2 [Dendrobium catenatum]|uniref:transcription factor LHW isoform X2 n=1 Tax=Dendrobium catenatum TaxID=906689 RepID=UPI0009F1A67D|nr:transcription factor LHW isoform X2 [Dendrobium catenatum]
MGFELRETLRRLCVEIGWSYAVFWRAIGSPNPKHLVWEDGHWHGKAQLSGCGDSSSQDNLLAEFRSHGEGSIDELVSNSMVPQFHVIGDGIVGRAALIGNHQWILRDVANDSGPILSHLAELKNQFVSGIQTIVIVPVMPYGVVQFGSTMRVMENNLFVNNVRATFMKLLCEPGSDAAEKALCRSSLQHASMSSAVSDYQFRDDCSNTDRSLSLRCNHQLSISSATKSLSQTSSSLSSGCHEILSKIDSERLSTKKIVSSSSQPVPELCQPMIHPDENYHLHLNNRLGKGLVDSQVISHRDMMSAANGMTLTTDNLSYTEENFPSVCGSRNQDPVSGIKASVEDLLGELDAYSLHSKFATLESANGHGTYTSAPACTKENSHGSTQNINTSNGKQEISTSPLVNNSSRNKCQGMSSSGHLKQNYDLPLPYGLSPRSCYGRVQECRLGISSTVGASLGFESGNSFFNHSFNIGNLRNQGVVIGSSPFHLSNEKSSDFLPLAASRNDLFDVLGLHGSLDGGLTSDQQLAVDVTSCNTQLNHPPVFYSVNNDISCTDIFSESNTDQLLDAVVSKINPGARQRLDENITCKTSTTKVSSSSIFCGSPSNDGSASSGKKHGEYVSPSRLTSNAETAASTSVRSADSNETERVDETSKVNRKRPRPGEAPRPRPKDRQLIMDRVKELREIVPNGAKCSIDALLEKTIKHMLFLQSVAKHADKLRYSGEPKIISKDGGVLLKDNFQGGATWAFEVGSQPMTCPIIVEDLNPPREMLVEMLCEERGVFLEIADLIRGLGLTILKGVMEARKNKIWARFAVEANRDVTRMEIFLSLVRSLEPTIGSGAGQSIHNNNMPNKIFNPSCVPVTGISDPFR